MATATLGVSVTARTGKFVKGMKRARFSVRSLASSVGKMSKRMAKFGAVAGAAAVGGLALLTKQAMGSIDAIAKLADRIGDTTERVAGMQHAGEIMGVSAEAMAKSLEQLPKRLGELSMATGEAQYALDLMNLDFLELQKMAPSDAIRLIADRMANLKNQSERVAVATKFFGRAGVAMVNVLALGSKGIDKYQREAEQLGKTFSRWDAGPVEEFNDAILRMKEVFKGIGIVLAIELAPRLEKIITRFVDWAKEGEGVKGKVVAVVEAITAKVVELAGAWDTARASVLLLYADLRDVAAESQRLPTKLFNILSKVLPAFEAAQAAMGDADVGLAGTKAAADARKKAEDLLAGAMAARTAAADAMNKLKKDLMKKPRDRPNVLGGIDLNRWAAKAKEAGIRFGEGILAGTKKASGALTKAGEYLDKVFAHQRSVQEARMAGEFRQISLARTAFQGLRRPSRVQQVRDPVNEQILDILRERLTGHAGGAKTVG